MDFVSGRGAEDFLDDSEGFRLVETERIETTTIESGPETPRSSKRRTSRKLSRFEIVCDNPDESFDFVPGSNLEIVSRSIKVLQEVQEEKTYTSTKNEKAVYYLPRGFPRAKGAAVGRSRRKALLVRPDDVDQLHAGTHGRLFRLVFKIRADTSV